MHLLTNTLFPPSQLSRVLPGWLGPPTWLAVSYRLNPFFLLPLLAPKHVSAVTAVIAVGTVTTHVFVGRETRRPASRVEELLIHV